MGDFCFVEFFLFWDWCFIEVLISMEYTNKIIASNYRNGFNYSCFEGGSPVQEFKTIQLFESHWNRRRVAPCNFLLLFDRSLSRSGITYHRTIYIKLFFFTLNSFCFDQGFFFCKFLLLFRSGSLSCSGMKTLWTSCIEHLYYLYYYTYTIITCIWF